MLKSVNGGRLLHLKIFFLMNIESIKDISDLIGDTLSVFVTLGSIPLTSMQIKGLHARLDNLDLNPICEILSASTMTDKISNLNTVIHFLGSYLLEDPNDLLPEGYNFNVRVDRMELNNKGRSDIIGLWKEFEGKILSIRNKVIDISVCLGLNDNLVISGSQQQQENSESLPLPDLLNTDKAKALLNKAIIAGLCDDTYKWLNSKALLAYFVDKASESLGLCKGEYDGKPKTSWKPFEVLFGVKGLSGAKRDYQKTGTLPYGYNDVDKLFE